MEKSIMQQTAEHIELERQEAEEREGIRIEDHRCPECGKNFIPAPCHVYKNIKNQKVCSYTCSFKGRKRLNKWGG